MQQQKILAVSNSQNNTRKIMDMLAFLETPACCCKYEELESYLADQTFDNIIVVGDTNTTSPISDETLHSLKEYPLLLIHESKNPVKIPGFKGKMLPLSCSYRKLEEALSSLSKKLKPCRRKRNSVQSVEGDSPAIKEIRRLINKVAKTEASVLILGESGTGKEIAARMLHRQSERSNKPFIPVNCGAIPKELLESELFGHEKGAFTGAITTRRGRFEMAEGGTLFLDEIGDMDLNMQVKLLRVLQEKTYERVGGNKTKMADVRIIAATHRDLEKRIKKGEFREDLYYRLNVFPIEMPALRERKNDIPQLIKSIIKRLAMERGSYSLDKSCMDVLKQYLWPGNVRELSNLVERLRILYHDRTVYPADLPEKYRTHVDGFVMDQNIDVLTSQEGASAALNVLPQEGIDLKSYLQDIEVDLIQQALEQTNGVVAHSARLLGIQRTTLVEKIRKFDL